MIRVALVWTGLLLVAGCARTSYVNKKYRNQLSSSTDRMLILPVQAHGFTGGLRPLVEKLVSAEIADAFGARGLSMYRLRGRFAPGGFGNLPWQLAQGMYYRAFKHKSPEMKGTYPDWLDELPEKTPRFLGWAKTALSKAGSGIPQGMQLRYLLAAYADRIKILEDGGKIRFRVITGIFDGHEGRTVAVAWYERTIKVNRDAVRRAVTGVGQKMRQVLSQVFQ